MFPALQKRTQMRVIPHVVNHQQNLPVGQQFAESRGDSFGAGVIGFVSAQDSDQFQDFGIQIAGSFAQRYPQNAIVKRILNPFVVADGFGQRSLSVPARSAQRGGDGDGGRE